MSGFHYIEFSKTGSILLNAEEKDELFDYIDRLKAENEQLRKERDFYYQQVTDNGERAHEAIDALNAENAKLRELVRDLYKDLAAILGDGLWMEPYESEMMELGVEV